jgi:putative transposase
VTYETVRQQGKKFGKAFSDQIRQRAPARGDKWHMDGVSRTYSLGGVWSCMRDEGGPLDAGSQVQASNHCKLLSSKAMVVSVAAKGGT